MCYFKVATKTVKIIPNVKVATHYSTREFRYEASTVNKFKKIQNRLPFLNQFLLLRAKNPYKSFERNVPENLLTILWLILLYKADLCIFKTYRYFVVILYILDGKINVNAFEFLKCLAYKMYAEDED